jgi:hypothetical protein
MNASRIVISRELSDATEDPLKCAGALKLIAERLVIAGPEALR